MLMNTCPRLSQKPTCTLGRKSPKFELLLALLVFVVGAAHGQTPSVTGVSPNFGAVGTTVTVTGMNFGASQGSSSLTFCGLAASSIISWSDTSISGTVPSGPTWPTISCAVVVRANGVSSSCCTTSTVFDYSPPNITNAPAYGTIGSSVTISGVNFGFTPGTVTFNGVQATLQTSWDTSMLVTVPAGTTSGNIVVTSSHGVASNAMPFIVTHPTGFYLTPDPSTTPGLRQLKAWRTPFLITSYISSDLVNQPAGDYLVQAFDTAADVPNSSDTWQSILPASASVFMKQTAGTTGTLFPKVKLFLNGPSGTPICTATGSTALTTSQTLYNLSCTPSTDLTVSTSDRYYLWVGVSSTATPSSSTQFQLTIGQAGGRLGGGVTVLSVPLAAHIPTITNSDSQDYNAGTSFTITGTDFGATAGTVTFNGETAVVSSWSDTSITALVPNDAYGRISSIAVFSASNVQSNPWQVSVVAALQNITPALGPIGSSVILSGSGFGPAPGTVIFNNTIGVVTSWSDTSITATVPAGTTTGSTYVWPGDPSAFFSNPFTFTVVPAPTIASLSPTSGAPGTALTITGTGFGATQGGNYVVFNGTNAYTVTSWSDTSIVVPVPSAAITGNVVVSVNTVWTNGVSFTVTPPPPTITSLSPVSGGRGTAVTITGSGFGATQGSSTVTFNGTPATAITSWSDSQISTQVPTSATSGPVVVTANSLASNDANFSVTQSNAILQLASVTDTPLQMNLTSPVNLDWVHWGNPSGPVRKAGLSMPLISDYTPFNGGTVLPGNGVVNYSWSDGDTQPTVSGETLNFQNYTTGSGFQITVPADTSVKTLNLYVTVTQSQVQLQASLSDGSTPMITDTSVSDTDLGSKKYSIDFRADSPGQTLTVNISSLNGGWIGLEAANLTAHLPSIAITAPSDRQSFQAPSTISLAATVNQFDSSVAGVTFTASDGSALNSATAPFGANWGPLNQGHFSLSATATDNNSLSNTSHPISVDVIGTGGSLTVQQAAPSSTATDFTALGTADWVLWGSATQNSSTPGVPILFDRKAGVLPFITGYKEIGNHPLYSDTEPQQFTYSDGSSGENGEDYTSDAQVFGANNGFELTVAADTNVRTLQLFVGLGSGTAKLEAFLSDGSAPVVINQSFTTIDDLDITVYSITYHTASAGQTLTLRYTLANDGGYGSVHLIGAALSGQPTALNPAITGIQPGSGSPGTSISISGSGFGSVNGTSALTIGGQVAIATVWTDTQITALVPLGLSPGSYPISIYGVQGPQFTVVPAIIAGVQPSTGSAGSQVTISGSGFGMQPGTVTFGGIGAPVVSWSDTSIVVTVPTSLNLGSVAVNVNGATGPQFRVEAIVFTGIQPAIGPAGTVFNVTGSGFGWQNISGALVVGGVPASAVYWTDTAITAIVPTGTYTGLNAVTVNGNFGLGFTVTPLISNRPVITGLSSGVGAIGGSLTISGLGFGVTQGNGSVTIAGVAAPVTNWSDTGIGITIPMGATSGNLLVMTDAGQTSNAIPFAIISGSTNTSISPSSGPIGTTVTISGSGFGASQSTGMVVFDGTVGQVSTWNDSTIVAIVPSGASTGHVVVSTASGLVVDTGMFTVTAGTPVLQLSVKDTPITVNLTALANLDWIHWGRVSLTQPDRKAGLTTPLISDYSTIGNGVVANDSANFITYAWSDGTPLTRLTNSGDEITAAGVGNGFQITIPSDTSVKSLILYVGATQAQATLTASLSDISSQAISDSSIYTLDQQNKAYQIDFRAASLGQTLTVTYTETQDLSDQLNSGIGTISLQAAVLIPHLPSITIDSPAVGASFPVSTDIPLTASASQFDYALNGFEILSSGNPLFQLSLPPYSTMLSGLQAGHYYLTAQATDSAGNQNVSPGSEFNIIGTGGQLSETFTTTAGSINLTAEGTADWVLWGRQDTNNVDRKFGVDPQISDYKVIGNHRSHQITDGIISFTYNDADTNGTRSSPINSQIRVYEVGNGYELTVPADTTPRTLKLYVGADSARGKLVAFLSDGSASNVADNSFDSVQPGGNGVYAITYNAASASQTLTVRYTLDTDHGHGDIDLEAATLNGPRVAAPKITSVQPPDEAGPGMYMVIRGSAFGNMQGNSSVLFDGLPASIVNWSDTEIDLNVPEITESGTIVVDVNGRLSNAVPYTYEPGIRSVPQPIYITPDSITMFVGQTRSLSVVDQNGNLVSDVTLTVDKPDIADLESSDVASEQTTAPPSLPSLHGLAPGKVKITATSSLGTAVAVATIYSATALPPGQSVPNWTLYPTTTNSFFLHPVKGQPVNPGDPNLYVAELGGDWVRALDSNGRQLWMIAVPQGLAGDNVVAMPDGGVLFEDANYVLNSYSGAGKPQWQSQPLGNGTFYPAYNNTIYYQNSDTSLITVLDATTGQPRYTYAPQGPAGTITFFGHLDPQCSVQIPTGPPTQGILGVSVDGTAFVIEGTFTETFEWYGPYAGWTVGSSSIQNPSHLISPTTGEPLVFDPSSGQPTCTSTSAAAWAGVGTLNYSITSTMVELTPTGPGQTYTVFQDQDQNDQGPNQITQNNKGQWVPDPNNNKEGVEINIPFPQYPNYFFFAFPFDYALNSNGTVFTGSNGQPLIGLNYVAFPQIESFLFDGIGGAQIQLQHTSQGRPVTPNPVVRFNQGTATELATTQTLIFGLPRNTSAALGDNDTILQNYQGMVAAYDANTDVPLWTVSDPTFTQEWQVLSTLADGSALLESTNYNANSTTIGRVNMFGQFTGQTATVNTTSDMISYYEGDSSGNQPGHIFVSDGFTGSLTQVALPTLPNTAAGFVAPTTDGEWKKGYGAKHDNDHNLCDGFDPYESGFAAVMVPASESNKVGSNKVKIKIPNGSNAKLVADDTNVVTKIYPNKFTGETSVTIDGGTPGTTKIRAKDASTDADLSDFVLQVDVKPLKTVTAQMIRIKDPNIPDNPANDAFKGAYQDLISYLPPTDNDLEGYLNNIYKQQANITFRVNPRVSPFEFPYDSNGDGKITEDTCSSVDLRGCYNTDPNGELRKLLNNFNTIYQNVDFYKDWVKTRQDVNTWIEGPIPTTNYLVGFYVNLIKPAPDSGTGIAGYSAGGQPGQMPLGGGPSIIRTYFRKCDVLSTSLFPCTWPPPTTALLGLTPTAPVALHIVWQVVAHEFGHQLGRGGTFMNVLLPDGTIVQQVATPQHTKDNSQTLMQPSTKPNPDSTLNEKLPCRLTRDDWNTMNYVKGSPIPKE